MSFQSAQQRRRDLATSPPPTITKGHSLSCLSAILNKGRQEMAPERYFDLAEPYRNNPKYDPSPTFTHIRGGASPNSPRDSGGNSTCTTTLTKSRSMPEFYGAPSSASGALNVWECRVCHTRDTSSLERGTDSALVCKCGAVDSSVDMIGQARAKNCRKEDDATQVADLPTRSAEQAEFDAWKDGPETPEDKARRKNAHLGGTRRLRERTLRKSEMLLGQSRIESQALRDARDIVANDASDNGRGKRLLITLEKEVFPKLPSVHIGVKSFVRIEAVRIYRCAMRHEAVCGQSGCMFSVTNRANLALALGITELVLASLAGEEAPKLSRGPVKTIGDVTSNDCTLQDAKKVLGELRQIQNTHGGGPQPRMQVLSAVSLISNWETGAELHSCDQEWSHMPVQLRLPPSIVNCPDRYGQCTTADPVDTALGKLRRALSGAAATTFARREVRVAAAHQLTVPEVLTFARESGLPVDVLGISIIAAVAIALGYEDTTADMRLQCSIIANISTSTIDQFVLKLLPLIAAPDETDDGFPIF